MNLKEIFENDKRGLLGLPYFIKEINEDCSIINYYGQGDSHYAAFRYDFEKGWIFLKRLDFDVVDFSKEEVMSIVKNIVCNI